MLKWIVGLGMGALAVVAGIATYLNWSSISNVWSAPRDIAVRERQIAQWQAIDLVDRSIRQHPSPANWSAGAFIGTAALNKSLDALEGSRLEYVSKDNFLTDTALVIDKIDIRPELGRLEADLTLSAHKANLVLRLKTTAIVSYQGTERANEDTVDALLRIDPVLVQPAVGFGALEFQLRDFWAKLVPDLAVAFADPRLFIVRIPLADTMRASLKLKQEATELIGDNAKISYVATLPESTIVRRVSYSSPIVLPNGLWLFGVMSDSGQEILKLSDPPSRDSSVLRQLIEELERRLSAKIAEYSKNPASAISIRVNKDVFIALGNDIAALPDDKRRVDVKSTQREGRLAETKWRDNLLGDGGAFAELSGNEALKGSIQFGKPSVTWGNDRLALALPVAVTSESSVHVHLDPLIGGGAGTTIGINGSGAANIAASATPLLMNEGDLRAALLQGDLQCMLVDAIVASDGRLKVDFGWTKVPSIGAKLQVPIGREAMTPTPLFDGRPQFVEFPAIKPSDIDASAKPWRFIPAHRAIKIALVPIQTRGDAEGIEFSAELTITPLQVDETYGSVEKARQVVAAEASAYASRVAEAAATLKPQKDCALKPSFAVLLGGIEFGPENEIVKFARNAWHDLTKGPGPNNELRKLVEGVGDATDHAAKEAEKSANKLVTKPVDAVKDFGKQLLKGFH